MLIFQKEPHFVLPFSVTHVNLHLGNMIRNMDYGASDTFHKYMKKNVNHKLVPIQHNNTGSSVQRQLFLSAYYTTSKGAAAIKQPNSNI